MSVTNLFKRAEFLLKDNSPAVLTAIGVTGTVTTACLASKASYDAAVVLNADDQKFWVAPVQRSNKEKAKMVWKLYIPTIASGAITIGCIIAANKLGARKTAAITAAYSLTERAFGEYKDKVIETVGEKKEQGIRDAVAQDVVRNNPPTLVIGEGSVLCCELLTRRYFKSDMESLRKAQNDINAQLLSQDSASLSDFYHLLDLPYTSQSNDVGWTSSRQLELKYSTVLSPNNVPCIAFEYNYLNP